MTISVLIIAPEHKLDILSELVESQSMLAFDINTSKLLAISALLDSTFPAIQSTNNKPTPMITPRTVAYIHARIIDTVALHHSDSPKAELFELRSWSAMNFRNRFLQCCAPNS
jgi:hypothetical protein